MTTSTLDEQHDTRAESYNKDYESYDELGFMMEERLRRVNITSDDYWTPVNLPPDSAAYN